MEKKFYFLLFSLLLSGLVSARAQDSSGCYAGFMVSVAGSQAYFRAADSVPGLSHQWSFGDSTQTFTGNVQVTHTYSHAGAYFVTQVVSDSITHCRSISSQTVYITGNSTPPNPPPPDSVLPSPPPPDSVLPSPPPDSATNPGGPPIPPDSVLPSPPDTVLPNQPPPSDSVAPSAPDSLLQGHFISSYPNPATSQANLVVTMDKAATIYIRVYSSMGSEVLSTSQAGYPGTNTIVIPVASLPTGIYYVQLQYGNTILKSKIQKI
jgi:hypothetical protein